MLWKLTFEPLSLKIISTSRIFPNCWKWMKENKWMTYNSISLHKVEDRVPLPIAQKLWVSLQCKPYQMPVVPICKNPRSFANFDVKRVQNPIFSALSPSPYPWALPCPLLSLASLLTNWNTWHTMTSLMLQLQLSLTGYSNFRCIYVIHRKSLLTLQDSYPKHLSEVRISKAEWNVWHMKALGGPFGLIRVPCRASCSTL